MNKRILTFVARMLTTAIIGGLTVSALAASGAVSFNSVNLRFNGQQISAKGEDYRLNSGASVPASILYTDENGGGTTYLPIARISELLNVEIGWDGATESVRIGEEPGAVSPASEPNVGATASGDYSNWSEEKEAAYQEFKALWKIEFQSGEINADIVVLNSNVDSLKSFVLPRTIETIQLYCQRFGTELYEQYGRHIFAYRIPATAWLWNDEYKGEEWYLGYSNFYYNEIMKM